MAIASDNSRFSDATMHAAATMYYLEDATQGDVAQRLGVSRATVSRLLAQARRRGIVRIDVVMPADPDLEGLARDVERALGLTRVALTSLPAGDEPGRTLAPLVSTMLREIGLRAGDALLVSSGRTSYEVARSELPPLPGVHVAPMIGGMDEPSPWYATNEITRLFAEKVGGTPTFLYAPALPGADLRAVLLNDASVRPVLDLWARARCAVVGVGAAPLTRQSIPGFVPLEAEGLRDAVGDVLSRFYDADGRPVSWPGDDRLIAVGLEELKALPASIAIARGEDKIPAIFAGARAGYFDRLATDAHTAEGLLRVAG